MTELERECALYLKQNKNTHRIMDAILKRYISMSGVIGSTHISSPSKGEREFLRGLFKRDFSDQKTITISLKRFESAFTGTRFEGIELLGVLEAFFDKPLLTNRLKQEQGRIRWNDYFDDLINLSLNDEVGQWLQSVLEDKTGGCYKLISAIYKEDAGRLKDFLSKLQSVLTLLENSKTRLLLPVAAASVTKDPHSLDEGTDLLKLLLYYLSYHFGIDYPRSSEDKTELLYLAGIINDIGNRQVMTYGLNAYDKVNKPLGWDTFFTRREPLVLSLLNLEGAASIKPCDESANPKHVFSFENPSVFHSLIKSCPDTACICTSGQINTCAYRLMDLLTLGGTKIIYAGDFDPEGLLIAQRLKKRYKDKVGFIGYTVENYHKSLSDNNINEKRLKQLEKIEDPELLEIAGEMQKIKKAGYQEYIIDELVEAVNSGSFFLYKSYDLSI